MQALKEGWLVPKGERHSKPGWDSVLYGLATKAKVALLFDRKDLDLLLNTASEEQFY